MKTDKNKPVTLKGFKLVGKDPLTYQDRQLHPELIHQLDPVNTRTIQLLDLGEIEEVTNTEKTDK